METIKINDEIFQEWINNQILRLTGWSFPVRLDIIHRKTGEIIFGENLNEIKDYISINKYCLEKITIQILKDLNFELTKNKENKQNYLQNLRDIKHALETNLANINQRIYNCEFKIENTNDDKKEDLFEIFANISQSKNKGF